MRPYCKDVSEPSDNIDTLGTTKYDLYGLINHRGGGIGGMQTMDYLFIYLLLLF